MSNSETIKKIVAQGRKAKLLKEDIYLLVVFYLHRKEFNKENLWLPVSPDETIFDPLYQETGVEAQTEQMITRIRMDRERYNKYIQTGLYVGRNQTLDDEYTGKRIKFVPFFILYGGRLGTGWLNDKDMSKPGQLEICLDMENHVEKVKQAFEGGQDGTRSEKVVTGNA